MMADLIDREYLIDLIDNIDWYHVSKKGELISGAFGEDDALVYFSDIEKVIKNLPKVDVERKKGKCQKILLPCYNSDKFLTEYECSECKELDIMVSNFCPSCGADMRGDKE